MSVRKQEIIKFLGIGLIVGILLGILWTGLILGIVFSIGNEAGFLDMLWCCPVWIIGGVLGGLVLGFKRISKDPNEIERWWENS